MNFLQLVQRVRQECAVSGTGPSSVVDQTGMSLNLVNWTNDAWLEIQGMHDDWGWMRQPFKFDTVAGTGDYAPASTTNTLTSNLLSDLRYWYRDTFRSQKKSIGESDEMWLVEWSYNTLRDTYRFNSNNSLQARPMVFAVDYNGKDIMLGPKPDDVYEIIGDYQQLPTSMTANDDVPGLPEHLHMLIVFKAMISYGLYESAPEVIERGQLNFSRLMSQLEREQLPKVSLTEPLA